MSIINKFDLVLIGNIIVDEVYRISQFEKEGTSNTFQTHRTLIGGIGNMLRSFPSKKIKILVEGTIGNDYNSRIIKKYFQSQNLEVRYHQSKKPTTSALILSNLNLSERTSFVNWGCGSDRIIVSEFKTKWLHLSYLDICVPINLDQLRKQSNIISADLCLSKLLLDTRENIFNQLKYLDYLFISESEFNCFFNCSIEESVVLIQKYQLPLVIFHFKTKTIIISNSGTITEIKNPNMLIENSNVLGAGDVYCAEFIYHKLKNNSDFDAVLIAHQKTSEFIKTNNLV